MMIMTMSERDGDGEDGNVYRAIFGIGLWPMVDD